MGIRNGVPDLANRSWSHLAIIGTTVLVALALGYGVSLALYGTPEPSGVGVRPAAAPARAPACMPRPSRSTAIACSSDR